MIALKALAIPATDLHAAFETDDECDFAECRTDEYGDGFDYLLFQVVRVVNTWLHENPVNAGLGGTREVNGRMVTPSETIDLTLVGNTDGAIEGYEFSYDIWGERRLSLATGFSEYRDLRPYDGGIAAAIELAHTVIGHANYAIREANEFYAALV